MFEADNKETAGKSEIARRYYAMLNYFHESYAIFTYA